MSSLVAVFISPEVTTTKQKPKYVGELLRGPHPNLAMLWFKAHPSLLGLVQDSTVEAMGIRLLDTKVDTIATYLQIQSTFNDRLTFLMLKYLPLRIEFCVLPALA